MFQRYNITYKFGFAAVALAVAFYALFLKNLFVQEDVNPEAAEMPMVASYLHRAHAASQPVTQYIDNIRYIQNVKTEDPHYSFLYPREMFISHWNVVAQPLLAVSYIPFVGLFGVSPKVVAIYSTFFCMLACVITGALALRMYGRWAAVLSVAFVLTSIEWLIHTKCGYPAHMPSVVMMCSLAFGMLLYLEKQSRAALVFVGSLLGLMFLEGWIIVVFGCLLVAGSLLLNLRGAKRLVADGAIVAASGGAMALLFLIGYASYSGVSIRDIAQGVFDGLFYRFFQGGVPGRQPSEGMFLYQLRCLFIDSTTLDHLDKCLEGYPAIPWMFTLSFLIGLYYAIKKRSVSDKLLLVWTGATMGVLGFLYLYAHRYALQAIPAMGILAARGVLGLIDSARQKYGERIQHALGIGIAVTLVLSLAHAYTLYHNKYLLNKPAEFEQDRLRGKARLVKWIDSLGTPSDTLVVLSDPIMFARSDLYFFSGAKEFSFRFWCNYFNSNSKAEDVVLWEKQQLKQYRRIVYAFSTVLLGDNNGGIMNDFRPFIKAHEKLQPAWTYSYDDRPVSIFAFEVR